MCTPPPPPPLLNSHLTPRAPSLAKFKNPPTRPPGDRQALLADIRQARTGGIRLKPTKTNDRSAPIIGSVVSHGTDGRSAGNFPSPSNAKANAEAPADFASELSRAISAQQNRTLKKVNGSVAATQPDVPNEIRPASGQSEKPPVVEKRMAGVQSGEKARPVPIGPKPTLSQNRMPRRTPTNSASSRDGLSPANKETAGVSVKALREKLQNPATTATKVGHQRKADESGRVAQRIQHMCSAPSLAENRCALETTPSSRVGQQQQPPPLPAKPPSRKPSIEHRKNVADKFRTLKPQSVQQIDFSARSNRFRSNSSENLSNVTQPDPYCLDSDGRLGARRNDANGVDGPCHYGQRQVSHYQQQQQQQQPTPPPRPDVAPPPPPSDTYLPQRLFGCRSSLNVPPPPPRSDSLTHDLESTFTFVDISRLPPPLEFRHVRSVKRAAPKAPMTDRAF